MITRAFHTTRVAMADYGLLVGGGTSGRVLSRLFIEHLPEMAEYRNIQRLDSAMTKGNFKSVTVLFGDGVTPRARFAPTVLHSLLGKFYFKSKIVSQAPLLDNCRGAATIDNFNASMDTIASKMAPGDRLWIYINSHGQMSKGASMWNEWRTTEFLTPDILQGQLKKIPKIASAALIIDSCYSGSFLSLTSRNVTVITAANHSNPYLYTLGKGCRIVIPYLCKYFARGNYDLLTLHSLGRVREGNYIAKDSLTYYLDVYLKSKYSTGYLQDNFQSVLPGYLGICVGFIAAAELINALKGFLGEPTLTLAKFAFIVAIPRASSFIFIQVAGKMFYKNWYVLEDLPLLKDRVVPLRALTPEANALLESLKTLKELHEKEARKTSYNLLYDKAFLFSQTATEEEMKEMIAIGNTLTEKRVKVSLF